MAGNKPELGFADTHGTRWHDNSARPGAVQSGLAASGRSECGRSEPGTGGARRPSPRTIVCATPVRLGLEAVSASFGGTAHGRALSAYLPLDNSAPFLSHDPRRLPPLAQRAKNVPCAQSGRNFA